MLSSEVRDVVSNQSVGPLAGVMVNYLENLQALPGIEHRARFDRGGGPTGVCTVLYGAPFAWLYPGRKPHPVARIRAPQADELAARHSGVLVATTNVSRGRRDVMVSFRTARDIETAEAIAREVFYSIQRPVVITSRGAAAQWVARAGEHFVAAELNRRGAYAVTFAGNMPNIDILASDSALERAVMIQVKTRRKGTWHSSTVRGMRRSEKDANGKFWVFVDLPDAPEHPSYYVAPEWWILNDIFEHHQAYLKRHGGRRARNPDSTHHAIQRTRIEEWRDRWDVLKIF